MFCELWMFVKLNPDRKKKGFSDIVSNIFSPLYVTLTRVEKVFCINQYLFKLSKLINKDLAQNKMYNYFNIGDAKTLVKLKEK